MSTRWAQDAHNEQAAGATIEVVVALMTRYDSADPAERPAIAKSIRQALAGEPAEVVSPPDDALPHPADAEPPFADDEFSFEAAYPPPEPTHVARERVRRQQSRSERKPHELQAAPTILAGVGSSTAEQLARLGIHRVVDLLWHLPARHEDFSKLRTIDQLMPGEQVTVIANLWDVRERKVGINRQVVQGILADGTGTLHATWWNKYVRNQLTPGSTMRFSGKVGLYLGQKTLDNPAFEDVDDEMVATGRLAPIYPLTEGLAQKRMRNLVRQALDEFVHLVPDPIPPNLRSEYDLPDLVTALEQTHFPDSAEQLAVARRRLAFDEFLYIQLGVLQRRHELHSRTAPA
ncbi:MAG: DNA helicase RecG, partial [Chloroflexi bacterium]